MERGNSNRTKRIICRLTEAEYKKIEQKWKATPYRKLSDYLRKKLMDQPIIATIRNQSVDDLITQMAALKKELNAIGNNFNQSVKKLHTLQNVQEFQRWLPGYEFGKQTLSNKLDEIKKHIQKIAESWLQ